MMKSVKNIAEDTKECLTKNSQIVNSKETNPKFRVWSEKSKLMQTEVWLKSNLTTADEELEINQKVFEVRKNKMNVFESCMNIIFIVMSHNKNDETFWILIKKLNPFRISLYHFWITFKNIFWIQLNHVSKKLTHFWIFLNPFESLWIFSFGKYFTEGLKSKVSKGGYFQTDRILGLMPLLASSVW